jgi:hypothetical protein
MTIQAGNDTGPVSKSLIHLNGVQKVAFLFLLLNYSSISSPGTLSESWLAVRQNIKSCGHLHYFRAAERELGSVILDRIILWP